MLINWKCLGVILLTIKCKDDAHIAKQLGLFSIIALYAVLFTRVTYADDNTLPTHNWEINNISPLPRRISNIALVVISYR